MKNLLLLPIVLLLCFSACRKKEEPSPYVRASSVIIGDYTNMVCHTYDSVVVYPVQPCSINLDVDNDHVDDFRLISSMWGSAGVGHHPRSDIQCLTINASLSGFFTTDTLFIAFDSSTFTGNDGKIHMNAFERLSCHPIGDYSNPIVIKPNTFKIIVKMAPEKVGIQDVFNSDSLTLMDESYGLPPYTTIRNDTVIHRILIDYKNCDVFPQDEVNYIGFRIMHGSYIKYGWIKLSLTDINKLIIFETAIQK